MVPDSDKNGGDSSPDQARSKSAEAVHPSASQPRAGGPAWSSGRRRSPSAARALAMLTLMPVRGISLPRVHVGSRRPDGALRVHDRPTGEELLVYTPRFETQFRGGHRAGRWYVRPAVHVGAEPISQAFDTARQAVEAVAAGRWKSTEVSPLHTRPRSQIPSVTWPGDEARPARVRSLSIPRFSDSALTLAVL
jgi:hypothetical protein